MTGDVMSITVQINDGDGDPVDLSKSVALDTGANITIIAFDNIRNKVGGGSSNFDVGPVVNTGGIPLMEIRDGEMRATTYDHLHANPIVKTCSKMFVALRLPQSLRPHHGILGQDQFEQLGADPHKSLAGTAVWLGRRVTLAPDEEG
ncbi:MAG: hypothetical protein ACXABY_20875 [Candidatus Thorarchaeota archaeon]|jgi:hypothetical protein